MFKNRKEAKAERIAQQEAEQQATHTAVLLQEAHRAHDAWEAAKLEQSTPYVAGVMLKRGEVAYMSVQGAVLIEPRKAPGQWAGGTKGVSIRVAKGVTYRTGGMRAQHVPGEEKPTPVDTGLFIITNQRCLFSGEQRTVEWAYAKLQGFSLEGEATAIFNVSNRQKASGVLYTKEVEHILDALIAAAIAKFQSEEAHQAVVAELGQGYGEVYRAWEASGGSPAIEATTAEELPPS